MGIVLVDVDVLAGLNLPLVDGGLSVVGAGAGRSLTRVPPRRGEEIGVVDVNRDHLLLVALEDLLGPTGLDAPAANAVRGRTEQVSVLPLDVSHATGVALPSSANVNAVKLGWSATVLVFQDRLG